MNPWYTFHVIFIIDEQSSKQRETRASWVFRLTYSNPRFDEHIVDMRQLIKKAVSAILLGLKCETR